MAKPNKADGSSEVVAARRAVVSVTSAGTRRRAGFSFGLEPLTLFEDELDEAKLAAIEADPLLVLRPPADPSEAAKE